MHAVRNFVRRQEGLCTTRDYDTCIKRLICYQKDRFFSFQPFYDESPIFAARFGIGEKYKHILALANEDGWVTLIDTNHWDSPQKFVHLQCHNNAIFDVAWSPNDMKLVTASGDHTAVLWNLRVGHCVPIAHFCSHSRSVKTTQFSPEDDNVVATGARDGNINIWDIRSFRRSDDLRPDNFITHAHSLKVSPQTNSAGKKCKIQTASSRASSITCLTYQDSCTLISCGAGDGCIKVWDLRKNYCAYRGDPIPVHNLKHSSNVGFTNLVLDPGKVRLYASCLNGSIFCYNIATYSKQPVAEYTGATIGTFYVKSCLSPDGRYLLSGSSDGMAYVWNTSGPRDPLVTLVRNNNEVTCVAWNPCQTQVVTCSDDPCFQFWEVGPENRNDCDDTTTEFCGWAEVKEPKCTTEGVDANMPDVLVTKSASQDSKCDERRTPSPPVFPSRFLSPQQFQLQRDSVLRCPTSNLPNSVRDGKFHLHRCEVGREKDVNWLVKINKELKDHSASCLRVRKLFTCSQPLRSATSSILPYLTGRKLVRRPSVPSPGISG